MDEGILKDTNPVSHPYSNSSPTCDSDSETEREAIPKDGPRIWSGARSFMGKSFEITVGHLVLVVAILALVAGYLAGIKTGQSRYDQIVWGDQRFVMVGLVRDQQNNIYMPIYRTEADAIRSQSRAQ